MEDPLEVERTHEARGSVGAVFSDGSLANCSVLPLLFLMSLPSRLLMEKALVKKKKLVLLCRCPRRKQPLQGSHPHTSGSEVESF